MHPVIILLLSSITTDWVWLLIFTRFLDHTQRRTTVGSTPLDEWSIRRRDLYLTTHNNHNRQTSIQCLKSYTDMVRIKRIDWRVILYTCKGYRRLSHNMTAIKLWSHLHNLVRCSHRSRKSVFLRYLQCFCRHRSPDLNCTQKFLMTCKSGFLRLFSTFQQD